jgi:hypothetical protein
MGDLPDGSNFYSSLYTKLSKEQVAGLYSPLELWSRKCSWFDYEIRGEWAELVIESKDPILMHGPVADVLANADRLLKPLRDAGVKYSAEAYDDEGNLIMEWKSP